MTRVLPLSNVLRVIAAAMALVGLFGCDANDQPTKIDLEDVVTEQELAERIVRRESRQFFFGFDLRSTPQEDARQYVPFIKYLERTTGLDMELRFTPKGRSIVDDLGAGLVHFAAIGADSYLQAHNKYGVIPLVRGLNQDGKAEYHSVIVVLPQSPIEKIEDLKGKRFAFGSKTSTQGHLIPRIILYEHNLSLEELASYAYTGSHYNCANEVVTGRADACGMQDTLGKHLAAAGMLRIVYTSKYYPSSGIAAGKEVDPADLEKVKRALLDFQPQGRDAAGLYNWDKTEMPNGFVEAKEEDYAELESWARRLGALQEMEQ